MTRTVSEAALALVMATAVPVHPSSVPMHDNAHVRVVTTTLAPRQPAALADPDKHRVLVILDGGRLRVTSPRGAAEMIDVKAGEVRWVPAAGAVTREAVSAAPVRFIEITLKGKPQPKVTVPNLDPIKMDPRHWSLVLENEHVRVARVRFGPLEKGVQHTHVRNYLVVYMTPQAKGNRGEVNLHLDEGATTHLENNPLDRAVERIAIELKE